MSLFGFLKSRVTAPVARERLQILLAHERISVGSSNLLAILRDELLATIARHIEYDPEKLSVKLERVGSVSTLEIDVESLARLCRIRICERRDGWIAKPS